MILNFTIVFKRDRVLVGVGLFVFIFEYLVYFECFINLSLCRYRRGRVEDGVIGVWILCLFFLFCVVLLMVYIDVGLGGW